MDAMTLIWLTTIVSTAAIAFYIGFCIGADHGYNGRDECSSQEF